MPSNTNSDYKYQISEESPVAKFAKLMLSNSGEVEKWFRARWEITPPPFYASTDIRNSGYRITTVDTNLFPAGFNNLHESSRALAVEAVTTAISNLCPQAMRVIIIPENHTRNQYYLANLWYLHKILQTSGVDVQIASISEEIHEKAIINIEGKYIEEAGTNDYQLKVLQLQRKEDYVYCIDEGKKFVPCMILLNNDLSKAYPEILKNISQPINPSPQLGWHSRLKSSHFNFYQNISREFAKYFDFPENILQSKFVTVDNIDFHNSENLSPLISSANKLFLELSETYARENIPYKPYIVMKADSGTYGMAVMAINSIEQLQSLNRKNRNKLAVGKEGVPTRRVILQEGIHSLEYVDGQSSEQVIYIVGKCAVGGFYRIHPEKNNDGILNSPGMVFKEIPFEGCCNFPKASQPFNTRMNQNYVAGVVARLAVLAAAGEIDDIK